MLEFTVRLDKAVADLTRQVRRRFALQFVGKEFLEGSYSFRVEIEPSLWAYFVVELTRTHYLGEPGNVLQTKLTKDNGPLPSEQWYVSEMVITQHMTVLSAIQCSAHLIGDFIKTAYASGESENDCD